MRWLVLTAAILALLASASAYYSQSLASFPSGSPWTVDVSAAPLDPNSATIISTLVSAGGFGTSPIQYDASINALFANCSTPRVPFTQASGYYTPDCVTTVTSVPLPTFGAIEGHDSWADSVGCAPTGEDCHVSILETTSGILYEGYQCDVTVNGQGAPTSLTCLCLTTWDTAHLYPPEQRGEGCTSVDAAGFPLQTLLATPEEAATGIIPHAVRFILPNARMRRLAYRHPASHYGGPTSTNVNQIMYGTRIRLQASFSEAGYTGAALAFIRGLKRYGAFLSDGGNLPFTIANDAFRSRTWASVGLTNMRPFGSAMTAANFEVLPPFGPAPAEFIGPYDCAPITFQPTIPPAGCPGTPPSPPPPRPPPPSPPPRPPPPSPPPSSANSPPPPPRPPPPSPPPPSAPVPAPTPVPAPPPTSNQPQPPPAQPPATSPPPASSPSPPGGQASTLAPASPKAITQRPWFRYAAAGGLLLLLLLLVVAAVVALRRRRRRAQASARMPVTPDLVLDAFHPPAVSKPAVPTAAPTAAPVPAPAPVHTPAAAAVAVAAPAAAGAAATKPVPPPRPVPTAAAAALIGTPTVVAFAFRGEGADELTVAAGEDVRILQTFDDGWCAVIAADGRQGVMPRSYLHEPGLSAVTQKPAPAPRPTAPVAAAPAAARPAPTLQPDAAATPKPAARRPPAGPKPPPKL